MKRYGMNIITIFCLLCAISACSPDDGNPGARPPGNNGGGGGTEPTDKVLKDAAFPVGAAIEPRYLDNEAYAALLKREMNSISPENAMKMDALSKGPGSYSFTGADKIVNFAIENDMRVHGHALVWYYITPQWVKDFQGDRDAWIQMMENYITDVVTHFKGKVTSWDVVNEALDDTGNFRADDIWYQNIGDEYVALAFKAANKADPDAILFYNDYGMEWSKTRRDKICEMVIRLKGEGVPIHGLGLQMHVNIDTPKENMTTSLAAAAACGVYVHVSELDVETNPSKSPTATYTQEKAARQRATYKAMFEAYGTVAKDKQYGITFWGVADNQSWLYSRPDWALPFDNNLNKKEAYYGIMETIVK